MPRKRYILSGGGVHRAKSKLTLPNTTKAQYLGKWVYLQGKQLYYFVSFSEGVNSERMDGWLASLRPFQCSVFQSYQDDESW